MTIQTKLQTIISINLKETKSILVELALLDNQNVTLMLLCRLRTVRILKVCRVAATILLKMTE